MAAPYSDADVLRLWHDVSLDMILDDEPELNTRQTAILLTIYLEPPPHSVGDLARKLGVTKPVITRAIDTMGQMDLVQRRRDEKDKRFLRIQRTVRGALYLEKLADHIRNRIKGIPGAPQT